MKIVEEKANCSHVYNSQNYLAAVEVAREEWRKVHRSVTLHSGEFDTYFWHRIDSDGNETDRNFNSGVPNESRVAEVARC
jgi:hypothetical protein